MSWVVQGSMYCSMRGNLPKVVTFIDTYAINKVFLSFKGGVLFTFFVLRLRMSLTSSRFRKVVHTHRSCVLGLPIVCGVRRSLRVLYPRDPSNAESIICFNEGINLLLPTEKCAEDKRAATLPTALSSPASTSPQPPSASNRPLPPTPPLNSQPANSSSPSSSAANLASALISRPWFHDVDRRRAEELVRNGGSLFKDVLSL